MLSNGFAKRYEIFLLFIAHHLLSPQQFSAINDDFKGVKKYNYSPQEKQSSASCKTKSSSNMRDFSISQGHAEGFFKNISWVPSQGYH